MCVVVFMFIQFWIRPTDVSTFSRAADTELLAVVLHRAAIKSSTDTGTATTRLRTVMRAKMNADFFEATGQDW